MDNPTNEQARSKPTVTVRGVGIAPARPDGVRVVLTVRHRAAAADQALGEAARKSQTLEDLFVELGIDQERWVTAGLGLEEWTEWDEASRRQIRSGYIAMGRVAVTLRNTDSLGKLLAEAVARTDSSVEGPWWDIDLENLAHDESRRLAMADARRRAEAYTQVAGLVLGPLLEIVEVGSEHPRRNMWLAARASGYAPLGHSTPEMPTHTEGLQIVAAVDVTYSLTTP